MNSPELTYRIDDTGVNNLLDMAISRGTNLRPALSTIGDILLTSIDVNFEREGRYSEPGSWRGGPRKWRQLSSGSLLARAGGSKAFTKGGIAHGRLKASARRKIENHKILQDSGQLAASFVKSVSDSSVTVGTNKVYAGAQHFGVDKTVQVKSHSRTSRSGTRYTVKAFGRKMFLPPRPIAVVQEEDLVETRRVLAAHILGGR